MRSVPFFWFGGDGLATPWRQTHPVGRLPLEADHLPFNRMTHTSINITLPQTSFAVGKK